MLRIKSVALAGVLVLLVGCGGGASSGEGARQPAKPGDKTTSTGMKVDEEAQGEYEGALKAFIVADKSGNWGKCDSIAEDFLSAARRQKTATNRSFPEAIYNAGLAYQRCN